MIMSILPCKPIRQCTWIQLFHLDLLYLVTSSLDSSRKSQRSGSWWVWDPLVLCRFFFLYWDGVLQVMTEWLQHVSFFTRGRRVMLAPTPNFLSIHQPRQLVSGWGGGPMGFRRFEPPTRWRDGNSWATGNGISAFVKLGPGVFLQSTGKDRMKPNGTTVQTGRVMGGVQLMHLNGIFHVVFWWRYSWIVSGNIFSKRWFWKMCFLK